MRKQVDAEFFAPPAFDYTQDICDAARNVKGFCALHNKSSSMVRPSGSVESKSNFTVS